MDEQKPPRSRPLKPWVIAAAIGAAVVVFAVVGLVLGTARLNREYGTGKLPPGAHRKTGGSRANSLCLRLNMAGNAYATKGMYDSALNCYREALRIGQEEGLSDRMSAAYSNISNIFDYLHMPESVRFYMNAAMALNRLSSKPHKSIGGLLEQGTYLFNTLGEIDSGKALLERGLAEAESKGDSWGMSMALTNLGLIQATLKHYDSARALAERSAAVCHNLKDYSGEAGAYYNIARTYMRRDRLNDAKKWLLKSAEAAHAGEVIGAEASALYDLALIRADQDEYELAQVSAEQSLKLYERAGDRYGAARSRYLVDELIDAQRWKHRMKSLDSLFHEAEEKPDGGV